MLLPLHFRRRHWTTRTLHSRRSDPSVARRPPHNTLPAAPSQGIDTNWTRTTGDTYDTTAHRTGYCRLDNSRSYRERWPSTQGHATRSARDCTKSARREFSERSHKNNEPGTFRKTRRPVRTALKRFGLIAAKDTDVPGALLTSQRQRLGESLHHYYVVRH